MDRVPARPDRERTWAASVIRRGRQLGPLPRYGSAEWCELPSSDPRFVAAVALAAECWREYCDPATVRRELELELVATRQVENRREAEDFADLAASVRALAMVPTQEALRERRQVVAS